MSRMWVDMGTLPSVPQGAGREAGGGAQVSNLRPTAAKLNASKVQEMRQGSPRLCWALLAHPGPHTTQALLAHALNTQDLKKTHLGSLCPCPPHPTPPLQLGLPPQRHRFPLWGEPPSHFEATALTHSSLSTREGDAGENGGTRLLAERRSGIALCCHTRVLSPDHLVTRGP